MDMAPQTPCTHQMGLLEFLHHAPKHHGDWTNYIGSKLTYTFAPIVWRRGVGSFNVTCHHLVILRLRLGNTSGQRRFCGGFVPKICCSQV